MVAISERATAETPFQSGAEIIHWLNEQLSTGKNAMITATPPEVACAFRIPAAAVAKIGHGLSQVRLRSSGDQKNPIVIIASSAESNEISVYRALYATFQVVISQAPSWTAVMNEAILDTLDEPEAEFVRNLLLKPTGYNPETDPQEMQVILDHHWQQLGDTRDALAGFSPENLTRCL